MNKSLYELTNEMETALNYIFEWYEVGEVDQELIKDTMESLQAPIEEKAENIIKYIKNIEALADAKKLEAKRLSESASADLKKAEKLKTYLADNLQRVGIKKLQAGVFALSFRKGSEVVEVDENKVPSFETNSSLYVHQEPKLIGKEELKKLIKDGQEIPGVALVRKPDTLTVK